MQLGLQNRAPCSRWAVCRCRTGRLSVLSLRAYRESLDVNADNRLPATHRFMFLVNSLLLSAAPVYLFSQIFDMTIPENALIFGVVCVVSAVILTMSCQVRSKNLVARLINKRGIELQVNAPGRAAAGELSRPVLSTVLLWPDAAVNLACVFRHELLTTPAKRAQSSIQLKVKDALDDKAKQRLKVMRRRAGWCKQTGVVCGKSPQGHRARGGSGKPEPPWRGGKVAPRQEGIVHGAWMRGGRGAKGADRGHLNLRETLLGVGVCDV